MKRRAINCQLQSHSDSSLVQENFTGMLPVLPLEVLEEMLLNVPPQQVVCVCRLVCREWKEVVDSDSLWRERCRREGYQTYVTKLPKDWRLFYFLCKKRRNLLKNPRADDKFKGWQIIENGGDKWKIESVEEVPLPDNTVQKYFATSYLTCRKSQLIDLEKEGYRPSFMDDFQPDIIISDWYAPRWDCGSEYEICVELLNHKKKPIKKFSPGTVVFQQWNDQKWNQVCGTSDSFMEERILCTGPAGMEFGSPTVASRSSHRWTDRFRCSHLLS
ncbi:F-box only protein 6-like isoform X2 [Salvelinus fontinalis]|uniref:F-box only protein 6-like isoform X2 n=1 Tax=Salvelinus fontinalis TaxID=8038 RepID=UPI002486333D|nr:F-box only protein 6-like isoform X2 [Salvelinus fontinalis]